MLINSIKRTYHNRTALILADGSLNGIQSAKILSKPFKGQLANAGKV